MSEQSISFYKGSSSLDVATGGVFFDSTNRLIKVKTSSGYNVYSGVQSVNWNSTTKTLTFIDQNGSLITINLNNGLPEVTSSDNGKILKVVNGEWSLITPPTVYVGSNTPQNSLGNDGDLYLQTN